MVVLCTNPAATVRQRRPPQPDRPSKPFYKGSLLSPGIALLGLTFPHPPTVWWSGPGSYRAFCSSANNAHVLQIRAVGGAQTPKASPTPEWGLHLLDASVALGNLIQIVKRESAAYVGA